MKTASLPVDLDISFPEAMQASLRDSDIFGSFYHKILITDNLPEFEKNLFSFMYEVLEQNSCLLYTIAGAGMGKAIRGKQIFTLQRGSYCGDSSSCILPFQSLPKMILLDVDALGLLQDNHACEPGTAAMSYFFAIADQGCESPLHDLLCEHGDVVRKYLRCGVVLGDSKNIFGLLLYEKPLLHPYLDKSLRLQQFREFLTLALDYRQIFKYATQDQLTGLYRKYYFLRLAEHRLCEDSQNGACQLLIMDIDYFKNFNDTYGHLKGTTVCELLAARSSIRCVHRILLVALAAKNLCASLAAVSSMYFRFRTAFTKRLAVFSFSMILGKRFQSLRFRLELRVLNPAKA